MRVAFYAPLKSPNHPVPSGDRRVARLLMDALVLGGHAVDLVSEFRSFEGRGDPALQAALRTQGQGLAAELVARWAGDGLAAPRPDLWLTYHLYYKAPDWIGPAVCRALGLPYAVAEASFAPKRAAGPWAVGHAAVQDALQLADLLLCPTADDMPALQSVTRPAARLWRLPPFLDPEPYLEAARLRQQHRAQLAGASGLDTAVPWIVVSAMMRSGDKQASYEELAQVLTHLLDMPWRLLVAGDGPAGGAIRAALERVAPGRCHFAGECDAARLAALYAASDMCLWPAVNEAYGMAMLEAQAAGTPVVSCAVRGVPEVVRDGVTGLLAPASDIAALAACARRLLQDAALRAEMGRAAARFVVGERSTTQAARLLQDALATLPPASGREPRGGVAA